MNSSRAMYTRKSDNYETPQWLFDRLNEEFHFTLDACADDENHKCNRYFTESDDGLMQNWGGETVYCNPPYSNIKRWAKKCYIEGHKPGTTVVMLAPSRTDTQWFHRFCYHKAEIRFVCGRLRFSGRDYNAPFPSMIVIYRGY